MERKKAFIYFLLFFTVTITIVIAAFFFSIEVPFADNTRLRYQVAELENEKELSRSFQAEFIKSSELVKTLDSKEVEDAPVNAQINSQLTMLNSLARNVPDSQYTTFLFAAITSLNSLKDAKNELRDLGAKELDVARLMQEISQLKIQNNQKDMVIAAYQARFGRLD